MLDFSDRTRTGISKLISRPSVLMCMLKVALVVMPMEWAAKRAKGRGNNCSYVCFYPGNCAYSCLLDMFSRASAVFRARVDLKLILLSANSGHWESVSILRYFGFNLLYLSSG